MLHAQAHAFLHVTVADDLVHDHANSCRGDAAAHVEGSWASGVARRGGQGLYADPRERIPAAGMRREGRRRLRS